jgi:hypothetical protein
MNARASDMTERARASQSLRERGPNASTEAGVGARIGAELVAYFGVAKIAMLSSHVG